MILSTTYVFAIALWLFIRGCSEFAQARSLCPSACLVNH
jgi:hypothetical protein